MRHQFAVVGDASPQLPLRVLGLFAQQDVLPRAVTMTQQEDQVEIVIDCGDLSPHRAGIILAKIEMMVLVRIARLESRPDADCPTPV